MNKFRIYNIGKEKKDSIETLGTKEKFWFYDNGIKTLFKAGRLNTGEDWVEVVISEICNILEIPHAKYSFAKYDLLDGTISSSFVPSGARLIHGNELLVKAYKTVDINYEQNTFYQLREYKLKVIAAILQHKKINPAFDIISYAEIDTAFGMFIGYLVLDCIVSNQDRHHENWGLIVHDSNLYLAPTYDHASGLGSKESDDKKEQRMKSNDKRFTVKTFVEKARTPFYGSNKKLSTYESVKVCAKIDTKMTIYWLNKLEDLDLQRIEEIFSKIPMHMISQTSILFANEMIKENINRLLELKKELEHV